MYFETLKDWEVQDEILNALGSEDGALMFRGFRQLFNDFIFLVDATAVIEHDEVTHTFFMPTFEDALGFIKQEGMVRSKISLISMRRHNDNNNYSISDIEEVLRGETKESETVYIYKCNDKNIYTSSFEKVSEKDLLDIELLYFQES